MLIEEFELRDVRVKPQVKKLRAAFVRVARFWCVECECRVSASFCEGLSSTLDLIEAVRFRVSKKGTRFLGYWVPFNSVFLQGTRKVTSISNWVPSDQNILKLNFSQTKLIFIPT